MVHMWRIPPEMRHYYQQYIFHNDNTTLQYKQSPKQSRRASGAPRIAFSGFGKPLHDSTSLLQRLKTLSYPARAGIPCCGEGANTPSPASPNYGHRNASNTILCQSIVMPDSSGLGKPPSRTLLLSG